MVDKKKGDKKMINSDCGCKRWWRRNSQFIRNAVETIEDDEYEAVTIIF